MLLQLFVDQPEPVRVTIPIIGYRTNAIWQAVLYLSLINIKVANKEHYEEMIEWGIKRGKFWGRGRPPNSPTLNR